MQTADFQAILDRTKAFLATIDKIATPSFLDQVEKGIAYIKAQPPAQVRAALTLIGVDAEALDLGGIVAAVEEGFAEFKEFQANEEQHVKDGIDSIESHTLLMAGIAKILG